ncbi:MAG TPA: hypothetical protein ENK66_06615 [Arcobacter sp.]|jgi:hypothetical protein|nr:hypothetical protein [Arcobacter sp.]
MRKSIVLLITLLFITAIAALIIKNVDDTQKITQYGNMNKNLVQLQMSINNINDEIGEFISNNNDNLSEVFEMIPEAIPLEFGDIKALVTLELYDESSYYLFDKNITKNLSDEDRMYIVDPYTLEEFIKENNITNKKQIDFVVDKYVDYVRDDKILSIKDKFIPKKLPKLDEQNNSIEYVSLEYSVQVGNIEANVEMIINSRYKTKEMYKVSIDRN